MTLFAFPSITGWPTIDDFVCPSPRRLFLAVFAPLAFGAMAGLPTHSRRPTTRRPSCWQTRASEALMRPSHPHCLLGPQLPHRP